MFHIPQPPGQGPPTRVTNRSKRLATHHIISSDNEREAARGALPTQLPASGQRSRLRPQEHRVVPYRDHGPCRAATEDAPPRATAIATGEGPAAQLVVLGDRSRAATAAAGAAAAGAAFPDRRRVPPFRFSWARAVEFFVGPILPPPRPPARLPACLPVAAAAAPPPLLPPPDKLRFPGGALLWRNGRACAREAAPLAGASDMAAVCALARSRRYHYPHSPEGLSHNVN